MNPVNLFFACDNAYVPFLAVTLTSLKENCNPKRDYALRILHTGLDPENIRRLTDSFASDGFLHPPDDGLAAALHLSHGA